MLVIKLGGSLASSTLLRDWLYVINRLEKQKIVIVPGGGDFAEQVRLAQQQWRFDDLVAHQMALLAMQQMALQFHGICSKIVIASQKQEIKQQMDAGNVVVWSPDLESLNSAGIQASWDVTSDSLSAWLAGKIKADSLVMVKSAPLPDNKNLNLLQQQKIVDAAFCNFTADAEYAIHFYHREQLTLFEQTFTHYATTKR